MRGNSWPTVPGHWNEMNHNISAGVSCALHSLSYDRLPAGVYSNRENSRTFMAYVHATLQSTYVLQAIRGVRYDPSIHLNGQLAHILPSWAEYPNGDSAILLAELTLILRSQSELNPRRTHSGLGSALNRKAFRLPLMIGFFSHVQDFTWVRSWLPRRRLCPRAAQGVSWVKFWEFSFLVT